MTERRLYVGADVHRDSTTFVAIDEQSREVAEAVVRTQTKPLIGFVSGLDGVVSLTLEAGCHAAWLHEILTPHVDRLIVCDPRKNKLIAAHGDKSDRIDAKKLAELLRGNYLTAVYHGERSTRALRDYCITYDKLVRDRTRLKNQVKAVFRGRGLPTQGTALYDLDRLDEWLALMPHKSLQHRAYTRYEQLSVVDELVGETKREMLREARKHEGYRILCTVPGVGPIRAATLVGFLQTPHRFRSREQLWRYAGLAVVHRTSADYVVDDQTLRRSMKTRPRGLNRHYNGTVKGVLKGAAMTASTHGIYSEERLDRLKRGQRPENIQLTIARRIAAVSLALWKNGEKFDASRYSYTSQS